MFCSKIEQDGNREIDEEDTIKAEEGTTEKDWENKVDDAGSVLERDKDDGNDRLDLNAMIDHSSLAYPEWNKKSVDWRYYTYQNKPTVAAHAQEVARRATTARRATAQASASTDDEEYNPTETSGNRNLVLATMRGTLVDFLDAYEPKSEKHAIHRNLVATERQAQINYDRNSRPLGVKRDIDYSKNGTIKDTKSIQSQYWHTIPYTLFVSIVSWLLAAEWNKEEGLLKLGNEVTVYGEKAGEKVNMNSFWATVTGLIDVEEGKYHVTDANDRKHIIERVDLRLRKRHSRAFGHITDDKIHDRHAMQHFTNRELKELESYMRDTFPEDIPSGKIARLHQHSDNASHFKSSGAM